MESVVIQGVELRLTPPDEMRWQWVGRQELKRQLLAAWAVLDEQDHALSPRLVGKPGVGKTTLASAAARALDIPLYVFQATMDTRPEDLLVTPVITDGQKLRYTASPLVSAMIKGGVCVLDEGNRMSERNGPRSRRCSIGGATSSPWSPASRSTRTATSASARR
ncbi:AAA family ATPase [Nannocystis pusilla]|uniref:AAA family ATPase n=1 Tax=Nannocystis pusilla TaxID=889268 RepID=A0A9X3IVC5_9BACT|nr:AAA family ATPase [Nannocystis pusilla]MCY1004750.1 AAA family ATPase [Nannocystis pusilla]